MGGIIHYLTPYLQDAVLVGAFMVGLAGHVHVANNGLVMADPERIFMLLINPLFHPVMAGVLLAAILAAIMSTADSQLLVSSSALAEDFYKAVFRKDASRKQVMMVGRIAVIIIALIALALDPGSSVLGLVSYAWAGFGTAFAPTVLLSLYWPAMNRLGALSGIIVGGITVIVWKQLNGGIFDLYEIIPGFVLATAAIILVSKLSGGPDNEVKTLVADVENTLATGS